MRIPSTQKLYKNKRFIITAGTIIILLVAGSFLLYQRQRQPAEDFSGTAGISQVNYDPPTEAERQAGDIQKERNIDQQKINEANPTANSATVVISGASYYSQTNTVEIRAFISNIIEEGGTCTATLEKDGQTITVSHVGFKDATTTQCGALDIPRSQFTRTGTWNVTVTYTSAKATGKQTTTLNL